MPIPAALQCVEKLGELLCEAIHLLKASGIKNSVLDKADDICQVALPELNTISLSGGAKLAESAYEAVVKIKGAISK